MKKHFVNKSYQKCCFAEKTETRITFISYLWTLWVRSDDVDGTALTIYSSNLKLQMKIYDLF